VIEVRPATNSSEVDEALELRRRVFCDEQGVTLEADQDGRDPEAVHIVAVDAGQLVGTCRLVFDDGIARLGRMAVEPNLRGRGIGAHILEEAEREARAAGARRIRLHAQTDAQSLYERGGFQAQGEEFVEEGIPHVTMEKRLA
jgi:putative N-acetyltransferase (TIGR04045 family)